MTIPELEWAPENIIFSNYIISWDSLLSTLKWEKQYLHYHICKVPMYNIMKTL